VPVSDFLSRLAAKAIGSFAPAVQPRLPSRFEAEDTGSSNLKSLALPLQDQCSHAEDALVRRTGEEIAADGYGEEFEASSLRTVKESKGKRKAKPGGDESERRWIGRGSLPSASLPSSASERDQDEREALTEQETHSGMASRPERAELLHSAASRRELETGVRTAPEPFREKSEPSPLTRPRAEESAPIHAAEDLFAMTGPSGETAFISSRPDPAREPARDQREAGRPAIAPREAGIRVVPEVRRLDAVHGLDRFQKARSTQEVPNVRVTIGRIEVRAVTPPSSQAQPRPARAPRRPPMSLDEYLQGRNARAR
jgi:hypothetical protein